MSKVAIVCNGAESKNLYPAFIFGSSAIALGDELILFFTPGAAPALKKGELEKIKGKGMPDMEDLVEGVEALGARILLCELAFDAKDMKKEELREGVEVVGATSFMAEIGDAQVTFSF
ncbi:MAG: DsrE/DsrF/DrsH-like family protein [Candidatus Thermoplasmatota archaeon]|nr:DsrE/DsrF/DrsH-like family protein [Candidatus Thermoplasmatota archaeon]